MVAMTMVTDLAIECSACGAEIPLEARANFCPACGMPLTPQAESTAEVRRSANRWWLALAAVLAAGVLALGVVVSRLIGVVDADGSEGPAAEAMDELAPIAEDWIDERQHINDEADAGDTDGVAAAVDDAVAWIETAREDVAEIAAEVDGDSAPRYRQLAEVFDARLDALRGMQATGGATGSAVWADGEAQLDAAAAESDALVCQIAGDMRDEGDDPFDHVTPAMDVDC